MYNTLQKSNEKETTMHMIHNNTLRKDKKTLRFIFFTLFISRYSRRDREFEDKYLDKIVMYELKNKLPVVIDYNILDEYT